MVGGSYGLVRVSISPYFGFLVAMSESLDYITFTSFGVSALGKMISYIMLGREETPYNPLIWLVIYGMFLVSGIKGGNYSLWNFISIMTIGAILIKILYCFAAIPNYDYEENNDKSTVFASAAFVQALPFCASFFAGIEISTQLSCYVEKVCFRSCCELFLRDVLHLLMSDHLVLAQKLPQKMYSTYSLFTHVVI